MVDPTGGPLRPPGFVNAFPVSDRRKPGAIDLARGPVIQRLMGTRFIARLEVSRQDPLQFSYTVMITSIIVLVFHNPPQSLHEQVV